MVTKKRVQSKHFIQLRHPVYENHCLCAAMLLFYISYFRLELKLYQSMFLLFLAFNDLVISLLLNMQGFPSFASALVECMLWSFSSVAGSSFLCLGLHSCFFSLNFMRYGMIFTCGRSCLFTIFNSDILPLTGLW